MRHEQKQKRKRRKKKRMKGLVVRLGVGGERKIKTRGEKGGIPFQKKPLEFAEENGVSN